MHICITRVQWVKVMAYHQRGSNPLSEPMLTYCPQDPIEHFSVNFYVKYVVWEMTALMSQPQCDNSTSVAGTVIPQWTPCNEYTWPLMIYPMTKCHHIIILTKVVSDTSMLSYYGKRRAIQDYGCQSYYGKEVIQELDVFIFIICSNHQIHLYNSFLTFEELWFLLMMLYIQGKYIWSH